MCTAQSDIRVRSPHIVWCVCAGVDIRLRRVNENITKNISQNTKHQLMKMNHLRCTYLRRTLYATTFAAIFLRAIELPVVFHALPVECSTAKNMCHAIELNYFRTEVAYDPFRSIQSTLFLPLFLGKFNNDAKRLRIIYSFMKIALFIECDADEWRLIDWLNNFENCRSILRCGAIIHSYS